MSDGISKRDIREIIEFCEKQRITTEVLGEMCMDKLTQIGNRLYGKGGEACARWLLKRYTPEEIRAFVYYEAKVVRRYGIALKGLSLERIQKRIEQQKKQKKKKERKRK